MDGRSWVVWKRTESAKTLEPRGLRTVEAGDHWLRWRVLTRNRLQASCICIWTGDHKQTPGGLKKTPEAIAFRHKMMKRPIGLRCGTTLVQPHRLMGQVPT